MEKYPAYKKYKLTRCAWLPEIPEHWEFKRLKNLSTHNDEALDERTDPDLVIEYVDISSVSLMSVVATINQHLAYIKPTTVDVSVDYLLFLCERAYSCLRSESDGGGSTKGAITCEQIFNLEIPLPPSAEQAAIEGHLANKLESLHDMNKQVSAVIQRIQEYRSALITNAVTGKIDVRDFLIPSSSAVKAQEEFA